MIHQFNSHRPLASAKELLAAGTGVNQQDDWGWTLLHHAVSDGESHLVTVRHLLKIGGNPQIKDRQGLSAIDRATGVDCVPVKRLLKASIKIA